MTCIVCADSTWAWLTERIPLACALWTWSRMVTKRRHDPSPLLRLLSGDGANEREIEAGYHEKKLRELTTTVSIMFSFLPWFTWQDRTYQSCWIGVKQKSFVLVWIYELIIEIIFFVSTSGDLRKSDAEPFDFTLQLRYLIRVMLRCWPLRDGSKIRRSYLSVLLGEGFLHRSFTLRQRHW